MYVCLCLGITTHEIQQVIREGACSPAEVMRCSGAGTRCGSCRPTIAAMVSETSDVEGPRRGLPMVRSVPSAA